MKNKRSLLLVCVLLLMILSEIGYLLQEKTEAELYFPCAGIITADPACNMRRDPHTGREPLRELRKGVKVTLLGEVSGESVNGEDTWYEIQYGNIQGYVSSLFATVDAGKPIAPPMGIQVPGESEFLASLQRENFPESYIEPLLSLYRQHPQWSFQALHTNYDFDTAVSAEYRPGLNLVPSSSPQEYKSMADADFNYYSNTWYEYESGWVGASAALIAYQMDPRNFLDEIQIFQFEDQQYHSNISYREGLMRILSKSFMKGEGPVTFTFTDGGAGQIDASYAELIQSAGEMSGVSPYHLASRILQEVSPRGSDSVSGTYQDLMGYYNFYNIGATGGSDPVYSGLVTARDGLKGYSYEELEAMMFPWTDPWRSIAGGAVFIGKDYINVDQQTLYLQKFNLASRYSRPFSHQYMGNVLAPEYEAIDVYKAYEQMGTLEEAKTFIIPVFTNMPDYVPAPTGGGNPNNWLRRITINGEPLKNFNPSRYEYEISLPSVTNSVAIQAEPWNLESRLVGSGVYQLRPGINEIILEVQAPNGALRHYRLSINHGQTQLTTSQNLPQMNSSVYEMDKLGYIYGLDPATGTNTTQSLQTQYPVPLGYTTQVVSSAGSPLEGAVTTGSKLQLKQEGIILNEFPLVILGDTNQDGSIDVLDLNALFAVIAKKDGQPNPVALKAMDINQDGYTDILDLNAIFKHLSGQEKISQKLKKSS